MRQTMKHGAVIDAVTPAELQAALLAHHAAELPARIRTSTAVALDANGAGQNEVYVIPIGFDFEARRVALDLDTATDPNTGSVLLAPQTTDTDIDGTGTTVAAAAISAILTATPGATTYITGFEVTGGGATAGAIINITITGILGGTKAYYLVIPAGAGTSITPLQVEFTRPIPASAINTPITVNVPSFGAGNVSAAVTAHGFQRVTTGPGRGVEYLRSGTRIAYALPAGPAGIEVPGVETWGDEQGPYLRNGEVFEVKARGLTAGARLMVTLEGILTRGGKGGTT